MRSSLTGLTIKKLRLSLLLFFFALTVPTAFLIFKAYSQLKWEAFHQYQTQAEELSYRIDQKFNALLGEEEARAFTDYSFLNIIGSTANRALQRSPLSEFPVNSRLPGVIGYFQIDSVGALSSPLLPQSVAQALSFGVTMQELDQRQALQNNIHQILSENKLVDDKQPALAQRKRDSAEPKRESEKTATLEEMEKAVESPPAPAASSPSFFDSSMSSDSDAEGLASGKGFGGRKNIGNELDETIESQMAFDNLSMEPMEQTIEEKKQLPKSLGRVEDLKLKSEFAAKAKKEQSRLAKTKLKSAPEKRSKRIERNVLPEQKLVAKDDARQEAPAREDAPVMALMQAASPPSADYRIRIFESEVDAFEASLLDSGHFVLFRKVWRDGQRYIQGILIDSTEFFRGIVETAYHDTAISLMSNLAVAYRGDVVAAFSGKAARRYLSSTEELDGALLYQTRLSSPFSQLELIYTVQNLPSGPGATIINWVAGILMIVLCGGFYLMYRLGVGQINLARQQQDFVSAVSHELKTPLTSIRMYGEMLREGWADEKKKKSYYNYIHDESERLTRLINNVLQLARMTRNELQIELKSVTVAELMDNIRSKVTSQAERTGFSLNIQCDDSIADSRLLLDTDYFAQIIINLVDNALKFSAKSSNKQLDIACRKLRNNSIQFSIRDYGPGVPSDQLKKIFKLFYRSENELTRETVGTGIGLALVNQLAAAMQGQVDVVNQSPGAEFHVIFPVQS